jgi:H+/gluconate symporter-like permease
MAIFKKIMLLIATLAVAMLPFVFSLQKNMNQTWVDLFGGALAPAASRSFVSPAPSSWNLSLYWKRSYSHMTPQLYGILVLSLSAVAVLTAIFKRQINKVLSRTSAAPDSHPQSPRC